MIRAAVVYQPRGCEADPGTVKGAWTLSVDAIVHMPLPDSPHAMWVRDELAEFLHLPQDGTRVEVVGGEVIVSPGRTIDHAAIVSDIQAGLVLAQAASPDLSWRPLQSADLNLTGIGDGYIPDLTVLHHEILTRARAFPYQLQLAVEVTAPSRTWHCREPVLGREQRLTKWSGYALSGVPWHLLVERDPRTPGIILYHRPDQGTGRYRVHTTWKLGEQVILPEPLGFSFSTELWQPWGE
jgi:hypothetical protein